MFWISLWWFDIRFLILGQQDSLFPLKLVFGKQIAAKLIQNMLACKSRKSVSPRVCYKKWVHLPPCISQ